MNSNSAPSSDPVGDAPDMDRSIPVQRLDSPGGGVSGSVVEDPEDGVVILGYN